MLFLRQSTASQEVLLGPFLDDTDGKTAETGLTIANTDIKLFKHGATTEANKNSGGATHIASGRYYAVMDATDTDTLGLLEINVHVSGALPVRREFMVLPANVYDSVVLGSDLLDVSVTQWGGTAIASATVRADLINIAGAAVSTSTAQLGVNVVNFGGSAGSFAGGRPAVNTTYIAGSVVSTSSAQLGVNVVNFGGSAGTFASGRPEVNTTHAAGTAWGSGAITAASIATDAITAAKIAADAIGASELAADAVTEIGNAVADLFGTRGTVDVGTSATAFTGDSGLSATNDAYLGSVLVFTSGALNGQARKITGYVGSTRSLSFTTGFTGTPSTSDPFVILGRID